MIRTIYKLIAMNTNSETVHYYALKFSLPFILAGNLTGLDKKYLREYRCPACNKLLGKGFLHDKSSYLEIKCRGCGNMYTFQGEDKEVLTVRHKLLEKGILPDTE